MNGFFGVQEETDVYGDFMLFVSGWGLIARPAGKWSRFNSDEFRTFVEGAGKEFRDVMLYVGMDTGEV